MSLPAMTAAAALTPAFSTLEASNVAKTSAGSGRNTEFDDESDSGIVSTTKGFIEQFIVTHCSKFAPI
jgi:hypothetical protein